MSALTPRNFVILGAIVGLAVLLAFFGLRSTSDSTAEAPVVTTVYAYAALSEELLGTDEVVLLGGTQDLHDYEPSPQDLRVLEGAELLVANGGLDEWAVEARTGVYVEALALVETIEPGGAHDEHDDEHHEEDEDHEDEHDEEKEAGEKHDHGDVDPHVWTVPENLVRVGEAILEQRSQADTNEYLPRLRGLEEEYVTRLSACAQDTLVTTHDALGYLGATYDFEIIAAGTQEGELELSPQELARTLEEIEVDGARYLLASPLEDDELARTLAAEADLTVLPIHLLENPPRAELSLEEALRENLESLATALECEAV